MNRQISAAIWNVNCNRTQMAAELQTLDRPLGLCSDYWCAYCFALAKGVTLRVLCYIMTRIAIDENTKIIKVKLWREIMKMTRWWWSLYRSFTRLTYDIISIFCLASAFTNPQHSMTVSVVSVCPISDIATHSDKPRPAVSKESVPHPVAVAGPFAPSLLQCAEHHACSRR